MATSTRRRNNRLRRYVTAHEGRRARTLAHDLGNGAAKTEDRFAGQLGTEPRDNHDGGSLPTGTRADGPRGGPRGGGPLNGGPRGGPLNGSSLASPLTGNPIGLGKPPVGGPLDGVSDDFGSRNGGHLGSPLHIENP